MGCVAPELHFVKALVYLKKVCIAHHTGCGQPVEGPFALGNLVDRTGPLTGEFGQRCHPYRPLCLDPGGNIRLPPCNTSRT
jgi:hypothetical protein